MKNVHLHIVLILALIGITNLPAQLYHVENYSKKQGLPQLQVFDIEQDSFGFMWFGTGGGVARYDGQTFIHFSLLDGLVDNEILAICEDDNKKLWLGTALGISRIDISDHARPWVDTTKVLLPQIRTRSLYFDDHERALWVATKDSGIYRFKNDTISKIYDSEKKIYLLARDVTGNIWSNDGTNLLRFSPQGTLINSLDMAQRGVPIALLSSTDSLVVIITNRGMYSVMNKDMAVTDLEYPINIKEHEFTDAIRDYEGSLWISSTNGLFHSNGNSLRVIGEKNGLLNDNIRCLKEDREGNIWIGTFSAGITKIISTHVLSFNQGDGQRFSVVNCIVESPDNEMFIGTDAGVFKYENQSLHRVKWADMLNSADVWVLKFDKNGRLLAGGDKGLFVFKKWGAAYKLSDTFLSSKSIFNIYQDRQDRIWIASDGHVYLFMNGFPAEFVIMPKTQLDNVWTIFQREDRSMLFGSTVGLIEFKNNSFRLYAAENGYHGGSVYVIYEDSKNTIWLGCDRGIYKFNDGRFTMFNKEIGWEGGAVTDILKGRGNTLWFCGDKGAIEFDGVKMISNLSTANGLIGDEFSTDNSALLDEKGQLWFGLFGGLTIFAPASKTAPTVTPTLFVSNVFASSNKTLNHPAEIFDGSNLDYDTNIINFKYSALSFKDEKQIQYQIFLEGYDQEWSDWRYDAESRYTNLDPGQYIFHVRARNGLRIETEKDTLFHFSIEAPFWQQPWFLISLVIIFLVVGYIILSVKTNSIARRNRLLENRVAQRTRALSQAKTYVESIIENVGDIIITTDNKGTVLTWNKEATRVFGYTKEEMLAQNIGRLDRAEDTVKFRFFIGMVKESGPIRQQELKKHDKNGQEVELLMSMNRLRNPFGGLEGFSIVLSDISERNRLHEALMNREKLIGQIDAMQKLLGTLSHHINNSVTAIYGLVQLSEMKNEYDEKFLSSTKYHSHKIHAVLKSLSALVEEVNLKTADYAGDKEKIFDIEEEIRHFIDELNKQEE